MIAAATIAPSHLRVPNPAPQEPEFVFSFKALGDRDEGVSLEVAEDAAKPIHMRGRSTAKPHRAPVTIEITIDGVRQRRTFLAKGISHDGPALDEWRKPLAAGARTIVVQILTGPRATPLQWAGTIQAEAGRLHVVTFEPEAGFRVE